MQICLNGHVAHDSPYCSKCGEPTIENCPSCLQSIKKVNAYCDVCGSAFPWTDNRIENEKELKNILADLTHSEFEELKAHLPFLKDYAQKSRC